MDAQTKQHIRSIASLTGVLALLTVGVQYQAAHGPASVEGALMAIAEVGSNHSFAVFEQERNPDTLEYRIAERLQQRLRKRGSRQSPSIHLLAKAVGQRQELLGNSATIQFSKDDDQEFAKWIVSAQRYPLWVQGNFTLTTAEFSLDKEAVLHTLETEEIVAVTPPQNAVLKAIFFSEDEGTASRGEIEGLAKPGYVLDNESVATAVVEALESGDDEVVQVALERVNGKIINGTNADLGKLELWATGLSNYAGSTYTRGKNVEKALTEHVNNTVVAPGETFSFNSTLDGPVSQRNGWHMAKVIFNGGDLEYAPGGGICQASTTVYRAILNAGFPVTERRAHSLYVSYYKEHGVGLDATIFPGTQDLVFTNDSDNYLVIQAYNDGYDAFVNIYGTPDGRTVALEGPYFADTAPAGYLYNDRKISYNEIVWEQTVTYADGRTASGQIASRYRTLPRYLAREYTPTVLHAAAGQQPRVGTGILVD